ncbi:HET-domain-containing protein [Lindgomyces ingoldianus]|uniref:HET-domain-containing protein n=1 Tax=Lindgomyces ingoldianus TaxID=673940 RepID=A0ACB6QMT6_9PLEO|nr:HET-domain-containing protein [Lindgomyces ingoldianus]KAF2468329.1 HET-domain-containing protein [Lindgomyces ingoldianus]
MILKDEPNLQFVPNGVLDKLVCEDAVKKVLEKHRSKLKTDISTLAVFVCTRAKRLFATLVFAEVEYLIDNFYEHDFEDEKLPVSLKGGTERGIWKVEASLLKDENKIINAHPFNDREFWTHRKIADFQNTYQWPFLCPVFVKDQFEYQFHGRFRMPFLDEESISSKESIFSTVEEWRIHRDHIEIDEFMVRLWPGMSLDRDDHPRVAVKSLKKPSWSDAEFEAVVRAEVRNLKMLRNINHPHLIRAIAYYKRGKKHYIMFPWAGQGSLRKLWEDDPPALDPRYLKWFFTQLCGLSEAIARLHHQPDETPFSSPQPNTGRSLRHGDLKPENILCFENSAEPSDRKAHQCVLKITDVGLSKPHDTVTQMRTAGTRTMAGTIMYEPPEVELEKDKPRSRRYDIWSMGCIYLEFLIWILYGSKGLTRFNQDLSVLGTTTRFYHIDEKTKTAQLNKDVQKWIDYIKQEDLRCSENTALRRLLELIIEGLLVPNVHNPSVKRTRTLRPDAGFTTPSGLSITVRSATFCSENAEIESYGGRLAANDMYEQIREILNDAISSEIEWMKWDAPTQQGPGLYGNQLDPSNAVKQGFRNREFDDKWDYAPDTESAERLFADPIFRAGLPRKSEDSKLCNRCGSLRLWLPTCTFSDSLTGLSEKSNYCNLCNLLLHHVDGFGSRTSGNVQFFRIGSFLTSNNAPQQPIVSLYTLPGKVVLLGLQLEARSPNIQIGLPQFPGAGSISHIKLLTEWIRSCDETHKCLPRTDSFLPTRVIDVGSKDSPNVRLFCDTQDRPGKYLALSHRWGSPTQNKKFCTEKDNLKKHEEGIRIADLPKTFRDAIHVTRNLGVQYLWIDSLCIIQNDEKDWEAESKLMEQVFSSAYATIAASCANGTDDGFLKSRTERRCVTMTNNASGSKFYLCNAIDDFHNHVDQGELNKRGWVLQERALSRRTIYFTEKQTYWECGEGVRCETLTKMKNARASFLGDANFPHSVDDYVKGKKIKLWQGLYEHYSNLALSFKVDRPVAIRGLEKRLIRTLATVGGYGVFDLFRHRSLLWQRSGDKLARISFLKDRHDSIPSWSWMAYDGGIKYMDVPFGKVVWNEDVSSPFKAGNLDSGAEGRLPLDIEAPICGLNEDANRHLILDEPGCNLTKPLKCVIIGSNQDSEQDKNRVHYVLVVTLVFRGLTRIYERVGVGILNSEQIVQAEVGETVHIR